LAGPGGSLLSSAKQQKKRALTFVSDILRTVIPQPVARPNPRCGDGLCRATAGPAAASLLPCPRRGEPGSWWLPAQRVPARSAVRATPRTRLPRGPGAAGTHQHRAGCGAMAALRHRARGPAGIALRRGRPSLPGTASARHRLPTLRAVPAELRGAGGSRCRG